jgi:hypothetical protein
MPFAFTPVPRDLLIEETEFYQYLSVFSDTSFLIILSMFWWYWSLNLGFVFAGQAL